MNMHFPGQYRLCGCKKMFAFFVVYGNRVDNVAGSIHKDYAIIGASPDALDAVRLVIADKGDMLLCFQVDDLWRLELF